MAEPTKHAGKTYNIVSNRHTMNELCEELSIQLGKTVGYVRQSYDEAKKNFLAVGVPEWQIDVLLDAYRYAQIAQASIAQVKTLKYSIGY